MSKGSTQGQRASQNISEPQSIITFLKHQTDCLKKWSGQCVSSIANLGTIMLALMVSHLHLPLPSHQGPLSLPVILENYGVLVIRGMRFLTHGLTILDVLKD